MIITIITLFIGFWCGAAFMMNRFVRDQEGAIPLSVFERVVMGLMWPSTLRTIEKQINNTEQD